MRTLTLAAVLAATLLSPVAASAADPTEDWRAAACSDQGSVEDAPAGPSTLVMSDRVPVDGLPGVQVGVDRLDFSGVTCDVLYVDGALPSGTSIEVDRNQYCATFDVALDGKSTGETTRCGATAGPFPLYSSPRHSGAPRDVEVIGVEAFRAYESEVLEREPGMPSTYVGKTMTTTHTGSSWGVKLVGTVQTKRAFDRSRATDRAARAAYSRQVAQAFATFRAEVAKIKRTDYPRPLKLALIQEAAADRRKSVALARKKLRLSLDGVRLVVRDFRSNDSGTLPPAA